MLLGGSDQNYLTYLISFWIFSIASATSLPFLVSFITFIRPLFSKLTRLKASSVCSIFTAWLYVQSTSFAKILPYLILVFFFKETSIKAGFLLKKMSKLSFIFGCVYFIVYLPIYGMLLNLLEDTFSNIY